MDRSDIVIIGSGIGGLASALRLSAMGHQVTVIEKAPSPGGKMRTVRSAAGPVDIGPTVLTMRWVFEDLFAAGGSRLEDHVHLEKDAILARHWWRDGTTLDLHSDPEQSAHSIHSALGAQAAKEYRTFAKKTASLFDAFRAPMMETAQPSVFRLIKTVLQNPKLIPAMAPLSTLAKMLDNQFSDPRLAQLFGRYATYVGGSPYSSPALLSLIAHSEALGVWAVDGGMHSLAIAIEDLAKSNGATFQYGTQVTKIITNMGQVSGVETTDGPIAADKVIFNGDPNALAERHLGADVAASISGSAAQPRSLSAWVYGFAARPSGPDLTHHNVFFTDDPHDEFDPISKGHLPTDPTLYICAQDRGAGKQPTGLERFEIIMNGAPTAKLKDINKDRDQCHQTVFQTLNQFGLTFHDQPNDKALTSPADFNMRFPASMGSLYGRSPHGMTASLKRPQAKTKIPGLYLVGGGAHPGAGIPMATLSALHVAAVIGKPQISTWTSRQMDMPGGTSTA